MKLDFRVFDESHNIMCENISPDEVAHYLKNSPEKLMLFTGFSDSEGKKIYDGDYVWFPYEEYRMTQAISSEKKRDGIYEVLYESGMGAWILKDLFDQYSSVYIWVKINTASQCQVVGNKYIENKI